MKITILVLFISLFLKPVSASSTYEFKLALIKEIKVLLEQNQSIYPLQIENKNYSLLESLLSSSYAKSGYECLYGGWPSSTIKVNGKTYCHDGKSSDYYRHSLKCQKSEFTCPPVLFGKDICVPYQKRKDRLSVYKNCSKKETTPFLGNDLEGEESEVFKEYAKIAEDICNAPASNKKVVKVNCDKILSGVSNLKSKLIVKNKEDKKNVLSSKSTKKNQKSTEECADCKKKIEGLPLKEDDLALQDMSPKLMYAALKEDFRKSKLCNPVYSYPKEDAITVGLLSLDSVRKNCSTWGKEVSQLKRECSKEVSRLKGIFNLDDATKAEWDGYLQRVYNKDDMGMYKIMLSAKQYLNTHQDPSLINKVSKKYFLESGLLTEEDGEITCPFPSFDSFNKALKGYNKLKSKLGKETLTIVDYTMPSNARRLFSFDMKNLKTMQNTWAAHGIGNNADMRSNPDGSYPKFSNKPGTNLSSDGFIIAKKASYGNDFGDNIILKGVDENNTNIESRAIVLHGDSRNGGVYKAFSVNEETKIEKMNYLKTVSINSTDDISIRKAANAPGIAYPSLGYSYGCIGVPDSDSYDRASGTYKNQLQMLRKELSGNTLIFNYSGSEMSSKYF